MEHIKTGTVCRFGSALAMAFAIAMPALAGETMTPDLQFTLGSNSGSFTFEGGEVGNSWANGNATFGFAGSTGALTDAPSELLLGWNLLVGADPFIVGNIMVTNTSSVTQTVTVRVSLPVELAMAHSLVGGSISGSVIDLNGNGASLASIGASAIYTGFTDFGFGSQATAGSLLSWTTVTAAPNLSASVGPVEFGGTTPSQPHGAVLQNITVEFRFMLSAGDAASFTSIFEVQAVPAPAALALFGLAGAVGGRRRR